MKGKGLSTHAQTRRCEGLLRADAAPGDRKVSIGPEEGWEMGDEDAALDA